MHAVEHRGPEGHGLGLAYGQGDESPNVLALQREPERRNATSQPKASMRYAALRIARSRASITRSARSWEYWARSRRASCRRCCSSMSLSIVLSVLVVDAATVGPHNVFVKRIV